MGHLLLSVILISCLFLESIAKGANGANGQPLRVIVDTRNFPTGNATPGPVISNITFPKDGKDPIIEYATIAKADSLRSCPIETLSPDLNAAVTQLVKKLTDSVSKIKSTKTDSCKNLQNTLTNTQTQLAIAVQNQFIANQLSTGGLSAGNLNQQKINLQIQQASAVNLMIMTASTMIQRECINSLDDRIIVQKLIGQVVTLAGIFMGGWQGIALAAGGQILGSLPIFKNDVDTAVELFQKYDEINERGSFLCLYRQMMKTSCLLFSEPEDQIIYGLDMTYNSGPTRTTMDSVATIERKQPEALHDAKLFSEILSNSPQFVTAMEKPDVIKKGSIEAFHELRSFCQKTDISEIQLRGVHPSRVVESIRILEITCNVFRRFEMPQLTNKEVSILLSKNYWSMLALRPYYESVRNDHRSEFSMVANTWESKKYFDNFRQSIDQYRDHLTGNQTRMNYLVFTKKLNNGFAAPSFKSIFKQNYHCVIDSEVNRLTHMIHVRWLKPTSSDKVRQRALYAMLDLCQTFDPTLVCLSVGAPSHINSLYNKWKKYCVGPKSSLCSSVMRRNEHYRLLDDTKYKAYFDSLCGTDTSTVVPSATVRGETKFSSPNP